MPKIRLAIPINRPKFGNAIAGIGILPPFQNEECQSYFPRPNNVTMPQIMRKIPTIHISKLGNMSISIPATIAMTPKAGLLKPNMRRCLLSLDSETTDLFRLYHPR